MLVVLGYLGIEVVGPLGRRFLVGRRFAVGAATDLLVLRLGGAGGLGDLVFGGIAHRAGSFGGKLDLS